MSPDSPNAARAEKVLQTVDEMAKEFMECNDFPAANTHRLAEQLRKAIMINRNRVLAAYLHARSGHGGAAL